MPFHPPPLRKYLSSRIVWLDATSQPETTVQSVGPSMGNRLRRARCLQHVKTAGNVSTANYHNLVKIRLDQVLRPC